MHWSSPFSSLYGSFPEVFSSRPRQYDKENLGNRSWSPEETFKIEKKRSSTSKPTTPTLLHIVPRKKVSTPLRARQALQSDEEDDKFDYLAKRLFEFPADAQCSISDAPLPPEAVNKNNTSCVLSGFLPPGNQCTPANFTLDVHAVLNVNETTNEPLPVLGISPASPLELHDFVLLRGSPDSRPAVDNAEALSSPENPPLKTFTTTKASLIFILAEPDVYIPGARRKDDWEYEDDKSEDHQEREDECKATENANNSYEDMILETDTESSPIPAISISPRTLSHNSDPETDDSEDEGMREQEHDGENEDVESDNTSSSPTDAVCCPVIISAAPHATTRLNPDAMPFVPRFAFTPSPSTEMLLPCRDSESHATAMNTAIHYDSERPWLAETTSADDIAFLIYFGLIDLPLP